MNLPFRFFAPRPGYDEILAGLRDQVIEIGTAVRFMEADKPVPQPRDDAGRFVSQRDITRARLERLASALSPEARIAARTRASIGEGRGK